jgi:hypothetical protein
MFLTPFWQQPFSDTKTPLIVREEENGEVLANQ